MKSLVLTSVFALALGAVAPALAGCSSGAQGGEEEVDQGALEETGPQVVNLPFYFGVPQASLTQMKAAERGHPYSTIWQGAKGAHNEIGLRIIAVPAAARSSVMKELAESKVIQTGDVMLSFRPGLGETIPYAHLQMGTTHAGIVRVQGTQGHTVDQPLDLEHNDPSNAKGRLVSSHYSKVPALHIVRPRSMNTELRANLDAWLDLAEDMIGSPGRPGFNDNYLAPATVHPKFGGNPANVAFTIGKGLIAGNIRQALGVDMNPEKDGEQQIFCSELAYHLLSLANCTVDEVRNATSAPECASKSPFPMMSFAGQNAAEGLGEGPLLNAIAAKGAGDPAALLGSVFKEGNTNSTELSSGHRGANKMLIEKGIVQGLQMVYQLRGQNANAVLPAQLEGLRKEIPANYSPTAFLIDTIKDERVRGFDYVATVVFVDGAQAAAVQALKSNPIPRTEAP